jgi:hypothetical protein
MECSLYRYKTIDLPGGRLLIVIKSWARNFSSAPAESHDFKHHIKSKGCETSLRPAIRRGIKLLLQKAGTRSHITMQRVCEVTINLTARRRSITQYVSPFIDD